MRFVNSIPFVRDVKLSRDFYEKTLGLKVLEDAGSFVLFETGFAIHDGAALEQTVWSVGCWRDLWAAKSVVVFRARRRKLGIREHRAACGIDPSRRTAGVGTARISFLRARRTCG